MKRGDTVVVLGTVHRVDRDGLVHVKLLDLTIKGGGEHVATLCFWPGAVFPVAGNIAVVSGAKAVNGKAKR